MDKPKSEEIVPILSFDEHTEGRFIIMQDFPDGKRFSAFVNINPDACEEGEIRNKLEGMFYVSKSHLITYLTFGEKCKNRDKFWEEIDVDVYHEEREKTKKRLGY